LGIRHVGEVAADLLADHFKDFDSIQQASMQDFETVEGVGEQMAGSLYSFFRTEYFKKLLGDLKSIGVEIIAMTQSAKPLARRVFVFTGSLRNITRNEAKQLVKKNGGQVVSSISAKVTDVVAGEKAGSKLDKALAMGKNILTEDAFVGLFDFTR
jgi:DNA ligase (NAD+)